MLDPALVAVYEAHVYDGDQCSCGDPIPGATLQERLLWHESHLRAVLTDTLAASPGGSIPIVDLGTTVAGLRAHAASLRVTAGYLDQLATILSGA